ncbi:hypothetical protein HYV58_02035 [Candidatus Peregrinibacteria bacterium]|nr:hypothetical protein [Candidatus Peregrinibacteria bacterium]
MKSDFSFKVTIVGCGNVGATAAYATLLKGIATELALIDVQPGKANGLALDMEHSLSFTPSVRLMASSKMEAAKGSRLIVVTAGKRQQEGETRLNLAQSNRAIFREMIPNIVKHAPDAILLIVTNPVDVLTFEALKFSKLPSSRVFGSGTMLDSARFQFHISEKFFPRVELCERRRQTARRVFRIQRKNRERVLRKNKSGRLSHHPRPRLHLLLHRHGNRGDCGVDQRKLAQSFPAFGSSRRLLRRKRRMLKRPLRSGQKRH